MPLRYLSSVKSLCSELLRLVPIVLLGTVFLSASVVAQESDTAASDAASEIQAAEKQQLDENAIAEPDTASEVQAPEIKPLDEKAIADLDALVEQVDSNIAAVKDLEQRIAASEGLVKEVLSIRLDRRWIKVLRNIFDLAQAVATFSADGFDVTGYNERVFVLLERERGSYDQEPGNSAGWSIYRRY